MHVGPPDLETLVGEGVPARELVRLAPVDALLRLLGPQHPVGSPSRARGSTRLIGPQRVRLAMRPEAAVTVASLLIVGAAAFFLSLGGSTPRVTPANVRRSTGVVGLTGFVVAPPRRIRRSVSFVITDRRHTARVHVLYPGAAPVSLRVAEQINVTGVYRNGLFLADADTLIAKCGTQEHC